MDPGALGVFVPIAGIAAWAAVKVAKISAQGRSTAPDPDTTGRLQALEHDIGALRQELSEAQERIDFAERLLAQRRPEGLNPSE